MNTQPFTTAIRTIVLAAPLAAVALSIGAGTAAAAAPGVAASSVQLSSPCQPPPPQWEGDLTSPDVPDVPDGQEIPVPVPAVPGAAQEVPAPATGPSDGIDDLENPWRPDCPDPEPPEECEEEPAAEGPVVLDHAVEPQDEIDDLVNPEPGVEPEDCPDDGTDDGTDETPLPTRIDAGYVGDAPVDYGVLLAGSAVLAATGAALSFRGRPHRQG